MDVRYNIQCFNSWLKGGIGERDRSLKVLVLVDSQKTEQNKKTGTDKL